MTDHPAARGGLANMRVTPEHFERIDAFLTARLEPLFATADDATSCALRALRSQVTYHAAAASMAAQCGPGTASEFLMEQSWSCLIKIARHWRDHPDFLPEFGQQPWDLEARP